MNRLLLACLAAVCAAWPADLVRVSPRDARYLELSSGAPYIPNGLNMIAPPGNDMARMEEWLATLAANGGNYIRVWLSSPFWDVEHEKSGVYDAEKARRIDRLLEVCRRHGIRVKFTLEHFRTIGEQTRQTWADKPLHHVSRGGPAQSIADFFNGEASREQFKRKIRWYAERYGSLAGGLRLGAVERSQRRACAATTWRGPRSCWRSCIRPSRGTSACRAWAASTGPGGATFTAATAPWRATTWRRCTATWTWERNWRCARARWTCWRRTRCANSPAFEPKRPILLAESGAVEPSHSGPFKLYAADREGMLLHDVLFAPFFAGAAGAGQIWHWDSYVAANDLWRHYARFAEAVKGLDPAAEGWQPVMVEHPRLRIYVLKGRRTLLAWCRDKRNTWEAELKNGEKPEVLRGVEVALDGAAGLARIYDPWANRWSEAKVRKGKLTLPPFSRSVVIRTLPSPTQ